MKVDAVVGGLFLLLCYLKSCVAYSTQSNVSSSTLRFLLLGDWGKGGVTGTYTSVLRENHMGSGEQLVIGHLDAENNKGGGGGGGAGGSKTLYQLAVARAMARFVQTATISTNFVIALGDNFYDNGVPSADSILWKYLWKDVYLPYRGLNIPWYPVFGNHDYVGGNSAVQAQLERTRVHADDDIWMMESTNFTKRFEFQEGEELVSVAIIFIDTTTLAPNQCNKCNR